MKFYASQWIKIRGKDYSETYELQKKGLQKLSRKELELLFDIARSPQYFNDFDLDLEDFIELAIDAVGAKKVVSILKKQNDTYSLVYILSAELGAYKNKLVKDIINFAIKKKDFETLVLIGRKIKAYYPKEYLNMYVNKILPLLHRYKYGQSGIANPVSCLIFLSPEIEMRVKAYMKKHNLKDALRRWNEYYKIKGV